MSVKHGNHCARSVVFYPSIRRGGKPKQYQGPSFGNGLLYASKRQIERSIDQTTNWPSLPITFVKVPAPESIPDRHRISRQEGVKPICVDCGRLAAHPQGGVHGGTCQSSRPQGLAQIRSRVRSETGWITP